FLPQGPRSRFSPFFLCRAGTFFRGAVFFLRFAAFFFLYTAFFFRPAHVSPLRFFPINADLVMIDIVTLPILVSGLDSSPALDWKAEILLHLRYSVIHAMTTR